MKLGDAFLYTEVAIGAHLHFVISDPYMNAERVVVVSVTTLRAQADQACVLHPGEHPFIERPSYVFYAKAKILPLAFITRYTTRMEPASDRVLERLLEGAASSEHLETGIRFLLEQQGLV
ncbi:MAG: hypothetical protein IT434_03170 [Phycisphaerales bacterium]|nr:hypothetical protein [Phycisphaerales bacterium]